MSIKIYEGYKVKDPYKLDETLSFIYNDVRTKNRDAIVERMEKILKDDPETDFKEGNSDMHTVLKYMRNFSKLKKLSENNEEWYVSFDVLFHVYMHKGDFYLVPWYGAMSQGLVDLSVYGDLLEDFSYWNNTDRSNDISEKEWESRGDAWREVLYRDDLTFMYYIIDCDSGGIIDFARKKE